MSQPNWKLIGNLGDVNPIDYGGYFIFEDTTGVHPPEAEYLTDPDENGTRTVYCFILESCTYQNGILSDNKFHPDHPAWFAGDLNNVCSYMGVEELELIRLFCSDDSLERASAWRMVGRCHGFGNLDQYPLQLNEEETRERYESEKYQTKQEN